MDDPRQMKSHRRFFWTCTGPPILVNGYPVDASDFESRNEDAFD